MSLLSKIKPSAIQQVIEYCIFWQSDKICIKTVEIKEEICELFVFSPLLGENIHLQTPNYQKACWRINLMGNIQHPVNVENLALISWPVGGAKSTFF